MDDRLTLDQLEALQQISQAQKHERPSACIARNAKILIGLKYVRHSRSGQLELTEKGQQTLFVRRCIAGLRSVANDPAAKLDTDVAAFLLKKGHIAAGTPSSYTITQRGKESLADIEAGEA
jgi:predicted transcriptional regulator